MSRRCGGDVRGPSAARSRDAAIARGPHQPEAVATALIFDVEVFQLVVEGGGQAGPGRLGQVAAFTNRP